jgi:hypothetical protein
LDLILHLGAHRTGSTAFQQMLVAGGGTLERAGLRALVHDDLGRIPGFDRIDRGADGAAGRAAIKAAGAGAEQVLISDENMIGDMGWNIRSGSFYRRAHEKLAAHRDFFGVVPKRIGLGIRAYADYWVSAHAYELSYRRPVTQDPVRFADCKAGLVAVSRGWRDLVDDVRAVFPGAAILVWPVEARVPLPVLGRRLFGLDDLAFATPPPDVNAAPVAGLIPAMEAKRAAEPGLSRVQMREWLAGHEPVAFDGFTSAQTERMDARYIADLRALSAGYAGVEFVPQGAVEPWLTP